jgi:hypothetical protein
LHFAVEPATGISKFTDVRYVAKNKIFFAALGRSVASARKLRRPSNMSNSDATSGDTPDTAIFISKLGDFS